MAVLSLLRARCVLVAWLVATATLVFGQTLPETGRVRATEAEVKAAYIFNFTLFTHWPSSAFTSPQSPLIIGIVGEDPFGVELDRIAAAKKSQKRPLKVVRVESGGDPPECHILFIAKSEKERVEQLLAAVKGKPVLTVSDLEPFCSRGGCIRFLRTDRTMGLFLNPGAAKEQKLRLSPELLAIGTIRRTDPHAVVD